MQNSNWKFLLLAEGLAAVGFVLLLIPYIPGIVTYRFGLYAIIMLSISFFVAWKLPSLIVSSILLLSGAIVAGPSLVFFVDSLPTITGSIIGVALGSWILILGMAKSITTAKALRTRTELKTEKTRAVSRIAAVGTVVVVVAVAAVSIFFFSTSTFGASSTCTQNGAAAGSVVQVSIYAGSASSANPPGYAPDNILLVIGVNNTVSWTNNDSAAHTVSSSSAPICGSFNSGNMPRGAVYTHTFTVPGTYHYYCKYHSWMTGTIVVKTQ